MVIVARRIFDYKYILKAFLRKIVYNRQAVLADIGPRGRGRTHKGLPHGFVIAIGGVKHWLVLQA